MDERGHLVDLQSSGLETLFHVPNGLIYTGSNQVSREQMQVTLFFLRGYLDLGIDDASRHKSFLSLAECVHNLAMGYYREPRKYDQTTIKDLGAHEAWIVITDRVQKPSFRCFGDKHLLVASSKAVKHLLKSNNIKL